MIYLEFLETIPGMEPRSHAVKLNVKTIHEAAQLFQAFEAGTIFVGDNGKLDLTSIGTAKRKGVVYTTWGNL